MKGHFTKYTWPEGTFAEKPQKWRDDGSVNLPFHTGTGSRKETRKESKLTWVHTKKKGDKWLQK